MKQERIILSFIMVLIGLLVAGIAFYLYQSTKVIPNSKTNSLSVTSPTPTPKPTIYLSLNKPIDEEVVDNKTLEISGKTNPEATVIIITDSDQEVVKPTQEGNFSTTVIIGNDQNLIRVQSILPNGQTTYLLKTVTYSTESF